MKKRIVSIILATLLVITMIPALPLSVSAADNLTVTIDTGVSVTLKDSDGDGYYEIRNADALYAFSAAVNGGNRDINGELTADIVVNKNVLNEDGSLNGDGSNFRIWDPIGRDLTLAANDRYRGAFDGNNHSVSGLYFNNPEQSDVGLFGFVYMNGKVQNVGVTDSYFSGRNRVGGVVGSSSGTATITNCYNTGTISGNETVGGVAGSSSDTATITNCYNTGTVSGNEFVGGVAGKYGSITNQGNIEITVTNCYNTGTVSGESSIGGVVGYIYRGIVSDCHNTGTVSGNQKIGGVVGYCYIGGTVSDSYNTGTVSGTNYVGGVVGQNYSGGNVSNSYNTGVVSGNDFVGGVVGYAEEKVTVSNCYNTSAVSGNQRIGGVVGFTYNKSTVLNCYNTGAVSGESSIGGVVGSASSSTISDCYNTGTVSGNEENEEVGGVVGYIYKITVSNCYYLDSCGAEGTGISATAEQFASGETAYLLQGEKTEQVWGQSIGDELSPVFGGKKVYPTIGCDGTTVAGYSNTEGVTGVHTFREGFCIRCEAECPHIFDQQTHECTVCGGKCREHKYEISTVVMPTCGAQGVVINKCVDCGVEYGDVLPALGHKITYTVTDTVHKGVCSSCGYVKEGLHNYSQTYTYETCTEDAYFTYTCDDCGYSYTKASTEKLGHTGGKATCKALAVCERCGEGYGEYADHIGGEATCTELAICDVCGEGYGELERHESESDDFDCTTPVYCSVCGAVTKEANATHTWDENNFCSNENCQETRGFTFTFKYGDEILFERNVHTGGFYNFEGFEERDGLTLVGWVADEDADEDGEADFYPIGDYIYVKGDLSFNAVYKLVYTVRFITYDIWEGSYTESFNPITGEAGQTVTLWDDFSPYYKFLGWSLTEGGEVVYEANEEITLSESLILYGVIRPYRATFELGDGAVWNDENGNPITVLEGDYSGSWIEIHNNFPVRPGYIFKGFTDQTDPDWLWEPWQDEDTGEWILDFYFNMSDLTMTAVWEECTSHSYENGVCSLCKKPEIQEDDILLGDINGDGTVNAMDTNLLKRILAGMLSLDDDTFAYADVNCDGQINGLDSNLLSRIISGSN